MTRMERNVLIVVIHILLNNAQHMGRNVPSVRKRIISPSFAEVVVVPKRLVIPNTSQEKMFMKWRTLVQQSLSMTLTVWNLTLLHMIIVGHSNNMVTCHIHISVDFNNRLIMFY